MSVCLSCLCAFELSALSCCSLSPLDVKQINSQPIIITFVVGLFAFPGTKLTTADNAIDISNNSSSSAPTSAANLHLQARDNLGNAMTTPTYMTSFTSTCVTAQSVSEHTSFISGVPFTTATASSLSSHAPLAVDSSGTAQSFNSDEKQPQKHQQMSTTNANVSSSQTGIRSYDAAGLTSGVRVLPTVPLFSDTHDSVSHHAPSSSSLSPSSLIASSSSRHLNTASTNISNNSLCRNSASSPSSSSFSPSSSSSFHSFVRANLNLNTMQPLTLTPSSAPFSSSTSTNVLAQPLSATQQTQPSVYSALSLSLDQECDYENTNNRNAGKTPTSLHKTLLTPTRNLEEDEEKEEKEDIGEMKHNKIHEVKTERKSNSDAEGLSHTNDNTTNSHKRIKYEENASVFLDLKAQLPININDQQRQQKTNESRRQSRDISGIAAVGFVS